MDEEGAGESCSELVFKKVRLVNAVTVMYNWGE